MEGRRVGGTKIQQQQLQNIVWWLVSYVEIEIGQVKK